MIKKIKKVAVAIAAVGMLFGAMVEPVQANLHHTSRIEASRNASNLVRATPFGTSLGSTQPTGMRLRIQSNVITIVNGVARNSIIDHPWTTHDRPRRGHEYTAPERTRTIQTGFVASQVAIRNSSGQWINQQHVQINLR